MRGIRRTPRDHQSDDLPHVELAARTNRPLDLNAPAKSTRLVYVDRLRVFTVVLVFLIHVCEVFNPWDEWHITSAARSRVAGEIVVVMAPWIMPLFMLLAGVSAFYSLQRRRNGEYVRERLIRIFLPLVLGVLILVPPQVYLERRLRGQFSGNFFQFYPHFFEGFYPQGNFSWHHLWFLGHLMVYSILALPLFRFLQHPRGRRMLESLSRLCSSPHGLLWLALPLILERLLLWPLFVERHMLSSDWSNHAILFVAYVYGFLLAATPSLGVAIDAQRRWTALVAAATTGIMVCGTLGGVLPSRIPEPYAPGYVVFWILYAVGAWACVLTVLGLGRKWLSKEGAELRYGREIGYEWYLAHQTVIVAAAYWVVRWKIGLLEQFVAILAISVTGTFAVVELYRFGWNAIRLSFQSLFVSEPEAPRDS